MKFRDTQYEHIFRSSGLHPYPCVHALIQARSLAHSGRVWKPSKPDYMNASKFSHGHPYLRLPWLPVPHLWLDPSECNFRNIIASKPVAMSIYMEHIHVLHISRILSNSSGPVCNFTFFPGPVFVLCILRSGTYVTYSWGPVCVTYYLNPLLQCKICKIFCRHFAMLVSRC